MFLRDALSFAGLNNRDICLGCCWTRDEIAQWTQMTDNEKLQVFSMLAERNGGTPAEETARATGKPTFL
jgi:predicted Fe-S protein YdhL (DUF1289 family)